MFWQLGWPASSVSTDAALQRAGQQAAISGTVTRLHTAGHTNREQTAHSGFCHGAAKFGCACLTQLVPTAMSPTLRKSSLLMGLVPGGARMVARAGQREDFVMGLKKWQHFTWCRGNVLRPSGNNCRFPLPAQF